MNKQLLTFCLVFSAYCPNVLAISGQSAECSPDGMSLTLNVPIPQADFLYQAPCPPAQANPNAVCLSESEFETVLAIPSSYRKCIDSEPDGIWDSIGEWTQAEKDAQDAADVIVNEANLRAAAEAFLDAEDGQSIATRAAIQIIIEQAINPLRADIESLSTSVNGVAPSIPIMTRPERTWPQLKSQMKTKIQSGNVEN